MAGIGIAILQTSSRDDIIRMCCERIAALFQFQGGHMKRHIAVCAIWAVMSLSAFAQAQLLQEDILGSWYIEGDSAMFEFYQSGNEYRARLLPISNPGLVDSRNPVDSLRNRPLAGVTIIHGLRFDAASQKWKDGKVYNPADGNTYSCSVKLSGDGARLFFRGYYGISLLGETRTWRRGEGSRLEVSGSKLTE
jgi:uncharacterized protein (DUF2147 family)